MKIITLIENLVYKKSLVAEHGLSLYVETEHRKILFDTGQSGNFMKNAQELGVEIKDIDAVVISHGHYDHTGGLYSFLLVNKRAKVYVKKEAFLPKFHGSTRFIGIVYDPALLDNRIVYVDTKIQLDENIYIMPDIPIMNPLDTHFQHFKIETAHGFIEDEFNDELYLCITGKNKLSIVSSCSHRGIANILSAAADHFKLPVNTVVGGFHIKNCSIDQSNTITNCLDSLSVKSIGVCHCTGVEQYALMACHFGTRVFYNHTGYTLTCDDC
jgi:7,8-dihydropterin-6-yl-methyl-4-(beta-D-ribofuranosyl)aminobenzene 5'-phosphate synthase